MATETIGNSIQEYRTVFLFQYLFLSLHYIDYGQRIKSVYSFCMHLLGIDTCTQSGKNFIAHGLSVCLSTHTIQVIVEVENQWQSASVGFFPKLLILIHGSQTDSFPNRTTTQRTITNVRDDDAFLLIDFLI